MEKEYYERMMEDYNTLKNDLDPWKVQFIELEIAKRKIVENSTSDDLVKMKGEFETNIEKGIESAVDDYLEKVLDNGGQKNGL
jgi:hypothetical protein